MLKKLNDVKAYVKEKMKLFGNSKDIRGKAFIECLTNIKYILDEKRKTDKIVLTINGGVANLLEKPAGIKLEIRDYDVEGIDAEGDPRCKKDEDGDWYQEMIWESLEQL